ncbi:peptidoglycan DD-metalloendopeptidase family protein [Fodinisporobacter ferrooxydans]|uniref:Peptidoglycan DD-metalloendopeptidase family protein n=1 Tax=Fodinisporobacter ferrooxydans TaxID=2901836 RepID=A0ABY4CST7_9BACL|nr:peptidoglycan DD-metalloendopeptidase family protein [Alicyclobacillaceae bacterium MYW30-H2]
MKKLYKSITSTVLFSFLATEVFFPSISAADQLQDIKQQYQQIQQNQSQRQQHINELKGQENTLENQISSIGSNLLTIKQKISDTENYLKKMDQDIADMKNKIAQNQKALELQNDLLKKRIHVMYENGTISYLDVIVSSTSFSDFMDRLSTLSIIAQQDKKILDQVRQKRQLLNQQQVQLTNDQQQRQQQYQQLMLLKQTQVQEKKQKQAALVQVQNERVKEQKTLAADQAALDQIAAQIQTTIQQQSQGDSNTTQSQQGTGTWQWPLPSSHVISSEYGWRDFGGANEFHNGIDIAAPMNTPITAVADGVVLFAGSAAGFGHWIVIQHPGGVMSVYGHMYGNGLFVKPGERVKAGQKIAAVGSDGQSTGPHLHFSVATGITNGKMNYVNPWNYLK